MTGPQDLLFEPNRGQAPPAVRFLSRGSGALLTLGPAEAELRLRGGSGPTSPLASRATHSTAKRAALRQGTPRWTSLKMRLVGATPGARLYGAAPARGRVSHFRGRSAGRWVRNLPTFHRVRSRGVYPGIDLVYYGGQDCLEYDFEVAPGASPEAIALRFEGVDRVRVDSGGDLVLTLDGGTVRQRRPALYQIDGPRRTVVPGAYEAAEGGEVRFRVGQYDHSRPLIIDPVVLAYSTYLGGSGADRAEAVAVDAQGSTYLTGHTESAGFPAQGGPDTAFRGNEAFVTKLTPDGKELVYSAFIGGDAYDAGSGIAVGPDGSAYVSGSTQSNNFPTQGSLHERFETNHWAGFALKLSPDGGSLVYSTYLGGSGEDEGNGTALAAGGGVTVVGPTGSQDYPTANARQARYGGGDSDAFVARVGGAGAPPLVAGVPGDANGNGRLDVGDVITTLKLVAGLPTPPATQTQLLDVDGRPGVTVSDVMLMLRRIAGLAPPA